MNHSARLTTLISLLLTLAAAAAPPPNILFIAIDDLRPELPCYGQDYIHAPHIEKLAANSRVFKRHYVQAPTCGASRFSLLYGLYPRGKFKGNHAIRRHTAGKHGEPSLPAHFKAAGYTTAAIGKVSHYPGGQNNYNTTKPGELEMPPGTWDFQPRPAGLWQDPKGIMHGYANGKARQRGRTPAIEAVRDGRYPDDLIVEQFTETVAKLTKDKDQPWLCMVGLIRPHLPFACPEKYLKRYQGVELPPIPHPSAPENRLCYHQSREFMGGYRGEDPRKDAAYADLVRRHYAACVSYADANVGRILEQLEKSGQAENTIIVLWGDHGWMLGDHGMWGKHSLYAKALHSPLIIQSPELKLPGKPSEAIAETIDIYPTLCQLAGLPLPEHLAGDSLAPWLDNPAADSKATAVSFWGNKRSEITRTEHRIFKGNADSPSLRFDLSKDPGEMHPLPPKE